ncbi:hypothetical protein T492DRAFT_946297 [Pavlovales sp. CCMP2436]|nr:hypothetical protein T492DRAFT_946297 [Pavlovales sp. CCMP2436]
MQKIQCRNRYVNYLAPGISLEEYAPDEVHMNTHHNTTTHNNSSNRNNSNNEKNKSNTHVCVCIL